MISRTAQPAMALWGDARARLEELSEALSAGSSKARSVRAGYVSEGQERLAKWRQEATARLHSDEKPVNVARLCHELNNTMPADSVLVADGGFAAHWTALFYDTKRAGRRYV